jgi:hypothetical protein
MEDVGRCPSCSCSDITAGRIGAQHEPFVIWALVIGFLDKRWRVECTGEVNERKVWEDVLLKVKLRG